MLDAKAELDGRLRAVIHDLCASSAGRITAAVPVPSSADPGNKNSPDPCTIVPAVKDAAAKEVPLLRQRLDAWLDDARTRETLVGAVRDQAVVNYESWYEGWSAAMRRSGRAVSAKGKGKVDDVWDLGVFAEWAASAFQVGREHGSHPRGRAVRGPYGTGSSTGASIGEDGDQGSISST